MSICVFLCSPLDSKIYMYVYVLNFFIFLIIPAAYFVDPANIDRMLAEGYNPSNEDVLRYFSKIFHFWLKIVISKIKYY